MKNVMIFQNFVNDVTYGHQWQQTELFNYFRAQIDNSLRLGWDPADIIICTNLKFNYKNVTIVNLEHECKFNKYFNKQFGIWELLDKKIINEPFWFHDFDDWQLIPFNFPMFTGDIGMSKYINFMQWNTGSIFIKPESIDIWELIVNFMKMNNEHPDVNNKGDENIVNMIYHYYPEIRSRFSLLDTRYNLGCTQFDERYIQATHPICIAAFKPNDKEYNKFLDKLLIPDELQIILNNHIIKNSNG